MSWDAGSIVGNLTLDVSDFSHGMLQAEGLMHLFPPLVTDFLESPLLGFGAAIKEAFSAANEAIEGTAARFHQIGLAAENLGVSTEFISTLGAAAKAKGVDIDQLSMSLKFLQQRAADALSGEAAAAKGFADVGISVRELTKLMEEPEELFYRVSDGIASIESPALRVQAASDLMSRAGFKMLALFEQGPESIKAFQRELGGLGGVVTEEQAKMGEGWGVMEAKFDAAWEGVKAAFAQPLMEQILGDSQQLTQSLADLRTIAGALGAALGPILHDTATQLRTIAELVNNFSLSGVGHLLLNAFNTVTFDRFNLDSPKFMGNDLVAGSDGHSATSVNIENVEVHPPDTRRVADAAARAIEPKVRDAMLRQYQQLRAAASHSKVSGAVGGGHRGSALFQEH